MSMFPDNSARRPVELDYGTDEKVVFNFFNAVYAWMAVGLAVTATVSFTVSQTPALMKVIYGGKGVFLLFLLGAWGIAYMVQRAAASISVVAATLLFLLYAAVIGAMISFIFLVYSWQTIVSAFFITGSTFGATSLYGFITKRDLTTMGSYLAMAAFGLFFASLVNIFMASNAFSWFITYAVLAVFIGLTAYETQFLKRMAEQHSHDGNLASRYAIVGSLMLYISFINMFMSILRILGNRK